MFEHFLNLTVFILLAIYCLPLAYAALNENRIIGGESTEINNSPYLVSIRYKKNLSAPFEHRCSGTIYSSNVILTTATCLIGLDANRLHVKAGSSYRSQNDGFLYLVEKYIIHPDYNIWFMDNDLALLKLAFKLTETVPKEVASIALSSSVPPVNSPATIVGWGVTNSPKNSDFSEVLQIAQVNIVADAECKKSYGENRLTPAMLCATGKKADACLGDAGGPLVYENSAVGLISWGNGCGNSDFPGVYTNLVHFKEWIENDIKKL